jgi:hypothetical protein
MTSVCLFEIVAITRPSYPAVLTAIINPFFQALRIHPPYLPFQIITIFQQVAFSIFIAIRQLGPAFKGNPAATATTPEAQQQQLQQLMALTSLTNQESQRLLALEVAPFVQNPSAEQSLREQLKSWIVLNEIRNDRGVQAAIQGVVQRRREEELEGVE